jgi:tRNA 2-thiouridine synthesizing protein A
MIETPARQPVGRLIDARGSYCPGPLMELIRVIREVPVGEFITLRSTDRGSRVDVPKWLEKAGHRLVGIEERDGYDEIVVEKLH